MCGKELVARAIFEHSSRKDKPFVAVNCAAIPDQLLESELFGVEKGAYTGADRRRAGKFEHCDGGTISLDEIGDMSMVVQGKVLRIIQEQSFQRLGSNTDITTDVRIIAATHRDLEDLVAKGEFREDLFYRLNGYTINLPPLRHRRDDIAPLLEYFLNRARVEMNKASVEGLTPAALDALESYSWPGNIRQLQSVVRQAMLSTTGTVIGVESLPSFIIEDTDSLSRESRSYARPAVDTAASGGAERSGSDEPAAGDDPSAAASLEHLQEFIERRINDGSQDLYAEVIDQLERFLFQRVLLQTGGNQSKAATMLGITRGKVRDRIAKFGLPG